MDLVYYSRMYFRVTCALDDLTAKMCDEPIVYDLARPYVTHISIYKQKSTAELHKGGPVLASCTTNLKLDESEGLRELTSAIAKSKDAVWANFEGLNNQVKAVHTTGDTVFSLKVTAAHCSFQSPFDETSHFATDATDALGPMSTLFFRAQGNQRSNSELHRFAWLSSRGMCG